MAKPTFLGNADDTNIARDGMAQSQCPLNGADRTTGRPD